MKQLAISLAAVAAIGLGACNESDATDARLTEEERDIARIAIDALAADLQIAKDGIEVDTILAVDWPDSSIGCPQPGQSYLQVITPGHKITLSANGQIHAVHEANGRAIVCHRRTANALGSVRGHREAASNVTVPVAALPCDSARLLKVRTVEMTEGVSGGTASRPIYYLSLDCGGKPYTARVMSGTAGFHSDELSKSGTLRVRVEDGKAYLKTDAGSEFEAVVVAAKPSPD